jgi:superfamily II DNA or RNA helicase
MTIAPHSLQRHALAALHRELGDHGRGVVVMPCGSGKTLLGRWFAEQTAARLTVVFVPSLALVPQTLAAYRADTSWQHEALIVCSDPSSGRAVTLDALGEHGLPDWARREVRSSTSQRLIAEFVAGPGPRLIISTYHSAPKLAGGLAAARRQVDLVVCDEAHRLAGHPRREFRAVLEDDVLPARRRLFLTATPVEAAAWAADRGEIDDLGVGGDRPLSLDDTDLFGATIFEATFGDAVAAGRLVDYDVQVVAPRDGQGDAGPLEAVLTAAAAGATRLLTFHSRVARAKDLAAALDGHVLPDGRMVRAEHVEARHRAPRRSAALGRLAAPELGAVQVLCSARVLSEGVDVPAVDTVVFAEPRSSAVDIVQAVGRAMRVAPGKTRGRVVLAVDPGADLDEDTAFAATSWRHVWITLRALASMDERFAARLRQRIATSDDGRSTTWGTAGPRLLTDLPDGVDLDRWLLRCLDRAGLGWWASFDALSAWAREHGHAHPSPQAKHAGVDVGRWVSYQRTARRAGMLDDARVTALQELPGWAWDARELAWWEAAGVWTRRHLAGAPSAFERWAWLAETPAWNTGRREDRPVRGFDTLADFAVDTAARRRRGELAAHLEAGATALAGWRWDLVDPDDGRMVDALVEYAAWKDDLNPPHDYVHDGPGGEPLRLGAWLTAVRRRRATGRLAAPLERELELLSSKSRTLRVNWEAADTAWRLGYLALRQFVAREGTCRVPYQHVEALPDHQLDLNRWCVVQRQRRRQGVLTGERIAALDAVPGWAWEVTLRDGYTPDLTDDEHGVAGFEKGCRCEVCETAHREDYVRVAATRARGHLRMLHARGAGQKPMARAARINPKTIADIISGRSKTVLAETEQTLLALTLDAVKAHTGDGPWGELVEATQTWRLVDEITSWGWPKAWISREIGQDGRALQLNRDTLTKRNADAVAEVHRRLAGRRAPERRHGPDGRAAGWVPLPTLDELGGRRELEAAS